VYPWGNTWDPEKCNNYDDNNPAGGGYEKYQTAPVGSYPSGRSPYGCQDMSGNVWEWCKDWHEYDYYSWTPAGGWSNPQGPTSGSYRVLRGGGWYSAGDSSSYDYGTRCAYRGNYDPSDYFYGIGFRLAR